MSTQISSDSSYLYAFSTAKVNQFHLPALRIVENVVEFQISMDDAVVVAADDSSVELRNITQCQIMLEDNHTIELF